MSDLNFFDTLGTGLEQFQNSYNMRKKYFIFTYIYKVLLSNWFWHIFVKIHNFPPNLVNKIFIAKFNHFYWTLWRDINKKYFVILDPDPRDWGASLVSIVWLIVFGCPGQHGEISVRMQQKTESRCSGISPTVKYIPVQFSKSNALFTEQSREIFVL